MALIRCSGADGGTEGRRLEQPRLCNAGCASLPRNTAEPQPPHEFFEKYDQSRDTLFFFCACNFLVWEGWGSLRPADRADLPHEFKVSNCFLFVLFCFVVLLFIFLQMQLG